MLPLSFASSYIPQVIARLTESKDEGLWGLALPSTHENFNLHFQFALDSIVEALTVQLQDVGSAALYCPREAPTRGAVSCTYEQWFPF